MGNGYKTKSLTAKECSILTWDAFQSYMKSILDKETKISDWQEGYIGVPSKLPYNAITQKEYSGINVVSLFFASLEQGYSSNGWIPNGELKNYTLAETGAPANTLPPVSDLRVKITYPSFFVLDVKAEDKDKKVYKDIVKKLKKAKVVGKSYKNKKGVIARTSYGVSIKTLNELGLTKEERRYFFATNYNETTVVNVSNIKEFVEKAQTVKTATKGGDNEKAEWLISKFSEADNCPVMINAENVSCPAYSPNAHKIFMPKGVYDNKETYYSSCLHEIGHATKKGLGRFNHTLPEEEIQKLSPERKKLYDILSNEKSPKAFYAYEELVAELSSVFMAQLCGMEKIKIVDDLSGTPLENHAAYLSSWLNTYDSEVGKTLLDFALTDVSMAVNYAISQSKFYEKFPETVGLLDIMLNKKMDDKNKTIETYFDTVIYNEKPLKEYVFDADNKVILTVPKEFTRFTVESNKENNFYNTNAADGELLDDVYRIVVTDENGTRTGVGIDKNNTLCLDDKNSLVFDNLSDVKDFASQIGITLEAITNNENIKGLEVDKTMGSAKQPTQNLLKEGTDFTISPEGVLEFLPHVKTITPVKDLVSDVGRIKEVIIPDGVTEIGRSAFSGCESLTSVTIPESVTEIGDRAFWGCENLTSVIVSNPETKIGNFAFDHCDKLKEIKFYDGITGSEQYNNSPSKESLFDTIEVSEQTSWVHRNGAAPFSENYPYVENKRISEVSKSLDSVMNGDKGNFSVGITPDFKKGYIVLRTYKGTETERNLDKALGENAVCFEPKTNDFTQYKCYLIKVSPEDCQGLKEKASFTSPQIVSKSELTSVFHDGKTTLPINEISPDFYQKTLQPVNKEFLSGIIDSLADKKEMSYSASKLKTGDPETDAFITDPGAYGPEVGAAITFNNAVEKNGLSRAQTIEILNQETCYTGMITESVSSNILTPQTNQQSNQNY